MFRADADIALILVIFVSFIQVVSGTMIRAIGMYQAALDEPDGGLENFERLAYHMNDFVDIFNGDVTRAQRRQDVLNLFYYDKLVCVELLGCVDSRTAISVKRQIPIFRFRSIFFHFS